MAETEQACGGLPHRLGRQLGIGIGAVAAGKQALFTEPALAATNGERDYNAVPDLQVGHLGT
jgi:hypothetical protein